MEAFVSTAKGLVETVGTIITLAGFIAGAFYFAVQSSNSFKLLRNFHAGKPEGTRSQVLRRMFMVVRKRPFSIFSPDRAFFRWTRILLEHEIFSPRPPRHWPLREEDENFGKKDFVLDPTASGGAIRRDERKAVKAKVESDWRHQDRKWRLEMSQLFGKEPSDRALSVDHAGELNDLLGDIKHYFNALQTLDLDLERDIKFLCPVRVQTGFVAPLHLLAGLLVRYNEKWGKIIAGFEQDTSDQRFLEPFGDARRSLREVQSFIYHCWLLWGPSIPLCDDNCGWWKSDYLILQYGFGDENNSVEVVGKRDVVLQELRNLIGKTGTGTDKAMAIPASVTGLLQYSSIAQVQVPKALLASWGGKQDERPILYLADTSKYDPFTGQNEGQAFTGAIRPEAVDRNPESPPSRYYSAYLWIMFILLRKVNGKWELLHDDDPGGAGRSPIGQSAQPWKCTIPFFEHANLADPETCAFGKRQLARKAQAGLVELASLLPRNNAEMRIAYACGVDDSNCGSGLAIPELGGGETIASLMKASIAAAGPDDAAHWLRREVDGRPLIDFEYFTAEPGHHPHSACALPQQITTHYEWFDQIPSPKYTA